MSPEISDILPILVFGIMMTVTVMGIFLLMGTMGILSIVSSHSLQNLLLMTILLVAIG